MTYRDEYSCMNEADRMKDALLSYAAVQPLDIKRPGDIQRDLRSIAGKKHKYQRMISDIRCMICCHNKEHEVHNV